MTHERERIASARDATMYRVEQRFNGRLAGKYFELEVYGAREVTTVRYAAFIDCWAAYLDAAGWKDPGGAHGSA